MSEVLLWIALVVVTAPIWIFALAFVLGIVLSPFAAPGKVRRGGPSDNIGGDF